MHGLRLLSFQSLRRSILISFALGSSLLAVQAQTVGGGAVGGAVSAPATAGAAGAAAMAAPLLGNAPAAALPGANALRGSEKLGDSLPGQNANAAKAKSDTDDAGKNVGRDLAPLGIPQYQQFVAESTGRFFPLFGYDLFSSAGYPSLSNVPVPTDYVVGPGDEIRVRIWGAVDADMSLTVDRNGQVNIPRVGTVNVTGTKAGNIESLLRAQVSRVYNNFQLSASMGQLRSMQVYIVGQARRPGAYTVSSLSTLISLMFESGGPSANGSMRNIRLKRDGKFISTLDLYAFINEGDKTADVRLLPGDVVVIPSAGPRVTLMGALDTPAIYELTAPEEALGKVLSYGGRILSLTSPHKVLLERIDVSRTKPRSVEERALDAKGLASTVRDGDMVSLFKISPEFSNAVTLRGNVAAPLRYAYRPGMRVADLIPERAALIQSDYYTRRNHMVQYESGRAVGADRVHNEVKNVLEEINWDYAVIERLDPKEIRSLLIPFNLSKAVRDKNPESNLLLEPGDIVTIFGVNDLPVSVEKRTQFVRVTGEVNVPGIYQIKPGETMDQVIKRAGGFTQHAYVYGTVFTREASRVQQQRNLDTAIRRYESEMNSQIATSMANQRSTDKSEASQQALLAAQRASLERMRGLRASGRIALELDGQSRRLPPIGLEDGDQISVPVAPSFVGVFGAVFAEASMVHRYNLTVRDYLEKAGLTRDADEDFLLVIRADGTVESDAASNRSWLSVGSHIMGKRLNPGDSIFVPEKIDRRTGYTKFMEGAKDWTAIFYQFGLGAAGLKVLKQ